MENAKDFFTIGPSFIFKIFEILAMSKLILFRKMEKWISL
jgi:hypothetical protein